MVAVPVLEALGVTVKVTGPGPGCVGGKTVAIVISELEALKIVAPPVSLAVKVCDGVPGPENESDTGVTVRVPAVTETITELWPPWSSVILIAQLPTTDPAVTVNVAPFVPELGLSVAKPGPEHLVASTVKLPL
jgi:hypothetical protein